MSHGPYQKKYVVSPEDMERLVDHYKGALMENSRLTHAARLAAKQHVLLASPNIPPATKTIRVKALGPAVRRATKRVQTMALPGAGGAAAFWLGVHSWSAWASWSAWMSGLDFPVRGISL